MAGWCLGGEWLVFILILFCFLSGSSTGSQQCRLRVAYTVTLFLSFEEIKTPQTPRDGKNRAPVSKEKSSFPLPGSFLECSVSSRLPNSTR